MSKAVTVTGRKLSVSPRDCLCMVCQPLGVNGIDGNPLQEGRNSEERLLAEVQPHLSPQEGGKSFPRS
ncbi:hypothetical protein ACFX2I_010160 [Malus domestica]